MDKDTLHLLPAHRDKCSPGIANDSECKQNQNAYSVVGGILAAFIYTFLIAASKMAVQALQGRIPDFELNVMRCFLPFCCWSFYFIVKWKLPKVEYTNIKATMLYSVNHVIATLAVYISVVYIPLASAESLYIFTGLISSVVIFMIILRQERDFSQVIS